MQTTYYLLVLLLASIGFIIWLTAYKGVNAFFALLLAALGIGLLSGQPLDSIASTLKSGFGHTMEKIGLLIILGTTLGVILERTGATLSMANRILQLVDERNTPLAITLTGFVIGFPIFCDSGFIILSGLNRSLVRKSQAPMPVMAAALATSLYAVHCLVPPHPGITAALGTVGGDVGLVMLVGLGLAIPAAAVGYGWSVWRGKDLPYEPATDESEQVSDDRLPSAGLSFLPVVVPIALIAAKSLVSLVVVPGQGVGQLPLTWLVFAGEPVVALGVGILLAMLLIQPRHKPELTRWLAEGVDKAGMILAIIAGGGMFGEMLQATGIGKSLGEALSGLPLGIFFPFLIAAILKTAQGSSTVAVITAASLVTPLLSQLGLHSSLGVTLAILSMGAGSMVVSHANDAYFWVISRFSNLPTATTLRVYSTATIGMGITVQLLIWLLFLVLK
jgi:GntP family gluconate:H+ symporter